MVVASRDRATAKPPSIQSTGSTGITDHRTPSRGREPATPAAGAANDEGRVTGGGLDAPQHPQVTATPSQQKRNGRKKQRAHITVASLNICGRCSANQSNIGSKWNEVHFLVKDKRIAILAIQEAHLDDKTVESIKQMYGRRLHVLHSQNPRTSNADGVAFVVNKDMIAISKISHEVIIPGRAMMLTIPWKDDTLISILNVYAPNSARKNEEFWKRIRNRWKQEKRKPPDVVLGDFNLVESERDRSPPRKDDLAAAAALRVLLQDWSLMDGWRTRFPNTDAYTFPALPGLRAQARLDRIYLANDKINTSEGWEISQTHVRTDHKLVSAQLVHSDAPFIGKGRWTMNLNLLKDDKLMTKIIDQGKSLKEKIRDLPRDRSESNNPQTLYAGFKRVVIKILRDTSKKELPKILQRIQKLEAEVGSLNNAKLSSTEEEDLERKMSLGLVQERIAQLEHTRFINSKNNIAAQVLLENETNSKFWNKLNKAKKPRDILFALEKEESRPGEDKYERRSDRMAEIARTYHDKLQDAHDQASVEETNAATEEVLNNVDAMPPRKARDHLEARILSVDVQSALRESAHGKAAGLDGLPYELWRALDERTRAERGTKEERFNPFDILEVVFNDIQDYGLVKGSSFAEGWMCPIYKQKGDRRNIANHRPITLLNTDYKLLTKIVATRMATVAQYVVHGNQAGFIPGRSIMDQIRLTQMMIDFAEATEEDGVIVALDQEKAYDKIDHKYLWRVLRKFNIPEKTIKLIQTLYDEANTVVVINGEISSPFRVRRGVRQGDPMSCILFDLAIEPLACTLRKSALAGYNIPGVADRLIVTLFADDTTVYLAAKDSYDDLMYILNKWCRASKAKFNEHKTQFIPIGRKSHRDRVIATRRLQPGHPPIPEGPLIVHDGNHIRILGAFLGNDTNLDEIWKPVMSKTLDAMERWKKSHPSLTGKTIITQMTTGGITQYLTTAHGMPQHIEATLIKSIRDFIWDGRRPKVAMDVLCAPKRDGGIGLLDLKSRNEAIDIMLLKSYLNLTETRPMWAFVADALLVRFATRTNGTVSPAAAVNPIIQYWSVNPNAKGLPSLLSRLLKAARKEKLAVNTAKPNRTLRRRMPAWFHIGSTKDARKLQNTPGAKCLRLSHDVNTIADLLRASMRVRRAEKTPLHAQRVDCTCSDCTRERLELGCKNPARCQLTAANMLSALHEKWKLCKYFTTDGLSLTPRRKTKNAASLQSEGNGIVTFDPSLSCKDINLLFRIHSAPSFEMPALRIPAPFGIDEEAKSMTIAIWSQEFQHLLKPRYAMAVYAGPDDPTSVAQKLPESVVSSEQAYLAAISECARLTPPFAPLTLAVQDTSIVKLLCVDILDLEQRGWRTATDPSLLKSVVSILRKRSAPTKFKLPSEGSVQPDYLRTLLMARSALDRGNEWVQPAGHPEYILEGAQLTIMSQALAYNLVRTTRRPPVLAKSTAQRILQIQAGIGGTPKPADIWEAIRDKAFTKPVSTFLWKLTHNAMSVGKYWNNIPGQEHVGECPVCKVEESMEHILCECSAPGRARAWKMTVDCLGRKNIHIDAPHITTIMACGLAEPPLDGQTGPGSTRLLRILLSETAFLIWKIRCERRIKWQDNEEKKHTDKDVENKWRMAINTRLTRDRLMASPRFGRKALKTQLVLSTWSGTLENEHSLPDDWIRHPRVLVGSGPPYRRTGRRERGDPAGRVPH